MKAVSKVHLYSAAPEEIGDVNIGDEGEVISHTDYPTYSIYIVDFGHIKLMMTSSEVDIIKEVRR